MNSERGGIPQVLCFYYLSIVDDWIPETGPVLLLCTSLQLDMFSMNQTGLPTAQDCLLPFFSVQ